MFQKWSQFLNWVNERTGGNPVAINTPTDPTGNSWEGGEIAQVETITNNWTGLVNTLTIAGVGVKTKMAMENGKSFWEQLLAAGQGVFNTQTEAKSNVQSSAITASAISDSVKFLGVVVGVVALLGFVFKLFK